jgi:thioredoxin reductase
MQTSIDGVFACGNVFTFTTWSITLPKKAEGGKVLLNMSSAV